MADVIELSIPRKAVKPKAYSIDVTQYPDDLRFTVNNITVDGASLQKIADELEKIAQIIRTDVITGVV